MSMETVEKQAREYAVNFSACWDKKINDGTQSLQIEIHLSDKVTIFRTNVGHKGIIISDLFAAEVLFWLDQRPENYGLIPIRAATTFVFNSDNIYVVVVNTVFENPLSGEIDGKEFLKAMKTKIKPMFN